MSETTSLRPEICSRAISKPAKAREKRDPATETSGIRKSKTTDKGKGRETGICPETYRCPEIEIYQPKRKEATNPEPSKIEQKPEESRDNNLSTSIIHSERSLSKNMSSTKMTNYITAKRDSKGKDKLNNKDSLRRDRPRYGQRRSPP